MLLMARSARLQQTFNEYFNAAQASLYERHANNFSEVSKDTDFLLTYVPSDEYLRMWCDIVRQGSSGKTRFGIAGNPLPYLRPFTIYEVERNNLNNERYNRVMIGGSYLF